MKFFAALKNAEFASAAFKAAGLNLDEAVAAGNTDVVKTALAKTGPDAEAIISQAKQENDELSTKLIAANGLLATANEKLKTAEQTAAAQAILAASGAEAIAATGVVVGADMKDASGKIDAAKFKAAHATHVASLVRAECVKAGIKPIDDTPQGGDPVDPKKKKDEPELKGYDKYRKSCFEDLARIAGRAA